MLTSTTKGLISNFPLGFALLEMLSWRPPHPNAVQTSYLLFWKRWEVTWRKKTKALQSTVGTARHIWETILDYPSMCSTSYVQSHSASGLQLMLLEEIITRQNFHFSKNYGYTVAISDLFFAMVQYIADNWHTLSITIVILQTLQTTYQIIHYELCLNPININDQQYKLPLL